VVVMKVIVVVTKSAAMQVSFRVRSIIVCVYMCVRLLAFVLVLVYVCLSFISGIIVLFSSPPRSWIGPQEGY
jgi:hypothetical protein